MKTIITFILLFSVTICFAQKHQRRNIKEIDSTRHFGRFENFEKLDSARTVFVKNKLLLNDEQSKKFWPAYNKYNEKKKGLMEQIKNTRKEQDNPNATDEQLKNGLKNIRKIKRDELELDENFQNELLGFLSVRQVIQLSQAEKEFMMALRDRIHDGRKFHGDKPGYKGMH